MNDVLAHDRARLGEVVDQHVGRLQGRDLRIDRQDHALGPIEDGEAALVEVRARVHDHEVVRGADAREDLLDVLDGDRLGELRRAGRCEDGEAERRLGGIGPDEVRVAPGLVVAGEVGDRLARADVEVGRHLTELEVEVDDRDPARPALGHDGRDIGRHGGRSGAALGAVDGDEGPRPVDRGLGRRERREVAGRREPDAEGLDPGLQLAGVEGLGDDVVGARLEEADPLLDVVRLARCTGRESRPGRPASGARGRHRPPSSTGRSRR